MTPFLSEISVNGVSIPAARIAAEAQIHPAPKGKPGLAWRAAARALALREAMLQEARKQGITPAPQETAPGLMETEEEAMVRQLLESSVAPAPVSEEELRATYDADPFRFRAPPLWEAAHILFAAPANEGEACQRARAAAEASLVDIRARPALWDDIARSTSACSSRDAGGRLGQIGAGDTVPQFEAALRSMSPSEIAGPIETSFGFHLIRLDAVAHGAVLPFSVVLPRLRLAAEKAAWVRAARDFAHSLLAKADVKGLVADTA